MYSANARTGCSTTAGCRPAHPPPGPAPDFRGFRAANPELSPSASARTSTSMCPGRRLRPPAPDPHRVASGRGRVPRTNRLRVASACGRALAPAVSGSPPGRLRPTLTPASPPPVPAPVAAPSVTPAASSAGRPDQPPSPPSTRPAGCACAGFCRVRARRLRATRPRAGSARLGAVRRPRRPPTLAGSRPHGRLRRLSALPGDPAACRPRPHPG
nr:translation initiation factor IF-2-like [Aegilops tauschii subsp. strangulata]